MKTLCEIIKEQVGANYVNLETAIKTYDRNALVCGAPAWRYVYHTIHSADKWFFNPFVFNEPPFHEDGMDNPDNPCLIELSDMELLEYLENVKQKTFGYLDALTDKELYECPADCVFTRMDLVLMQFRHLNILVGMLNGQTIERTGKVPVTVGPNSADKLKNGLYEV